MSYFETQSKRTEDNKVSQGYIPSTPFIIFIIMTVSLLLVNLSVMDNDLGAKFVAFLVTMFIMAIGIPALIGSLIAHFFVAPQSSTEQPAETSERYKKFQWVARGGVSLMVIFFIISKV